MGVHEQLPEEDQEVIRRCMVVLATTNLIEDWEFELRVRYTKQDIGYFVAAWPHLEGMKPIYVNTAINNCLAEICFALGEEIVAHYNLSQSRAKLVFIKWLSLNPELPQHKVMSEEENKHTTEALIRRVEERVRREAPNDGY